MSKYILGIESSCDDTSAAVLDGTTIRSNVIANQAVHNSFGGVVPELASRAHQQNIIPVVETALTKAGITKEQLSAVAFTRGPGLLGSLLVGTSFSKSFAYALQVPLIEVNHMEAHVLAHFIHDEAKPGSVPDFPFLCLTVSGGHTQIVRMTDYFSMEIIGRTIDDAAGEAFDKAAKILGLPYPGGPLVDKYSREGNPNAFAFSKPNIPGLDYSFSGLKTSFLYTVRDHLKLDPDFIAKNLADLCASIQSSIIETLMKKLVLAVKETGITNVAIAGGVSANSGLRAAMLEKQNKGWNVFIPEFQFTTDNAAMIAVAGYYKYLKGEYAGLSVAPFSRGA
jgi:N6-L-threonylcarbamoyladenine synthase